MRNRDKSVGEFGALPYRSTVGRRKMAEFRTRHSDCERMLHLRAHTFAPLTRMLHNQLKKTSLSVESAIVAICLENTGLRNEDAFYTAVERVSLRSHHLSESWGGSAKDNVPAST
jgi:hypothetical protein